MSDEALVFLLSGHGIVGIVMFMFGSMESAIWKSGSSDERAGILVGSLLFGTPIMLGFVLAGWWRLARRAKRALDARRRERAAVIVLARATARERDR